MTFHTGLPGGKVQPLVQPEIGAVTDAIEKIRAHVSSLVEAFAAETKNLLFGWRQ